MSAVGFAAATNWGVRREKEPAEGAAVCRQRRCTRAFLEDVALAELLLKAARCTATGRVAPVGGGVHVKLGCTLAAIICRGIKKRQKESAAGRSPALETTGYASGG